MKNTNLLSNESFQLWLTGKSDATESARWEAWLNESEENKRAYAQAAKLWEMGQFRQDSSYNTAATWSDLQNKLSLTKVDDKSERISRYERVGYAKRTPSWSRVAIVVCASLLIVAFIKILSIIDFRSQTKSQTYQTLTTDFGQRATLTFPDDTRIVLNANSSLRYPSAWQANKTNIFELQGEAYFDVTPRRSSENRFIIQTADGTVSVVGTEFAVHERGTGTRVAVTQGRVKVSPAEIVTIPNKEKSTILITRGHLLFFQRGDYHLQPSKVSVESYTTWWKNKMVLVETPFAEIVKRIEETYGVEVKVLDKRLLTRTLSGSIENYNFVVVTDAIAQALRVEVQRAGETIIFGSPLHENK